MSELDRRAVLEAAMDAATEEPAEEIVHEEPLEDEEIRSEDTAEESPKEEVSAESDEAPAEDIHASEQEVEDEKPQEIDKPKPVRPTTWKKEYLPIWDKLTAGEQLTPEESLKLAEYSNQRESEYKKGVSTYKQEADNAKSLIEAISPFVPELQKQNIHPAAWINNLGRAHMEIGRAHV